tara:strand:- start:288 stop:629 length:342 start_codon:yes stop_codon:yes gene_type:complete
MDSFITRTLHEDKRLSIEEIVIAKNRSIYIENKSASTYYYVVCGCIIIYEMSLQSKLLNTICIASGQLYTLENKQVKSILIESLDSFEYNNKILKIQRDANNAKEHGNIHTGN